MKSFSKLTLILLTTFLLFACSSSNNDPFVPEEIEKEIPIDVEPGMNLVGAILDGETPITGAVVSDGYTTAVTNEKGIYQMKAHPNTKFVFVSVPADCEIPMEKGTPKIYYELESVFWNKVTRQDFKLKKSEKKSEFTLLAMADIQIANQEDLDSLKIDMPKIVEFAKTLPSPVYGISLGDLVWDNMALYKDYNYHVNTLEVPVFHVIGNHDHNMSVVGNDALSAKEFEDQLGPTYYSYNIGDVHFVVLDDVYYEGGSGKTYHAEITQNQIDWLEEDLKHVPKDKLIIIGTHIATKRRNNAGLSVKNNQDLYNLLQGYKVRILSGHSHNNYNTTISPDIEENTLGAVSGAFWTGDLCNDGSPKGYGIYHIKGNVIEDWYYKGTNHDRDYQMKLYGEGEAVSDKYKNGLIFNIFQWHTNWSVDVFEDGAHAKTYTPSENITEKDRASEDYMAGDKKPARRTGTEPEARNDHMFYYKPAAGWKNVKVVAKDANGIEYSNTLAK